MEDTVHALSLSLLFLSTGEESQPVNGISTSTPHPLFISLTRSLSLCLLLRGIKITCIHRWALSNENMPLRNFLPHNFCFDALKGKKTKLIKKKIKQTPAEFWRTMFSVCFHFLIECVLFLSPSPCVRRRERSSSDARRIPKGVYLRNTTCGVLSGIINKGQMCSLWNYTHMNFSLTC